MSPAAAEFASACNAPGALPGEDVVVPPVEGLVVWVVPGIVGAAAWCVPELPQPAATASAVTTAAPRKTRVTAAVSPPPPEPRLNARRHAPLSRRRPAALHSPPAGLLRSSLRRRAQQNGR